MNHRIVEYVQVKFVSNPFAVAFVASLLLGLVLIPLFLAFPWLGNYGDRRTRDLSSFSLILVLIVANRRFLKRTRFWAAIIAIGLAHMIVLLVLTQFVPHPRSDQYLLLTYVDLWLGEWLLLRFIGEPSMREPSA